MIPHLEAESWPTDWNTVGPLSFHVCVPLRLTLISGICPPFHPFLFFRQIGPLARQCGSELSTFKLSLFISTLVFNTIKLALTILCLLTLI
jgi:hypothetical protein